MTWDEEQNELLKVRREKMETLREEGIDPFGRRFKRPIQPVTFTKPLIASARKSCRKKGKR